MLLLIIQSSQENYFLIGYLDEFTRSLVLILPKVCGYFKRINVKGGDKDRNSKLISFHIEDSKLLERKKKTIWSQSEDLKKIDLNVYDDVCIKDKIKTYGDKVCTNSCRLSVEEDGVECESFTITSDD